MIKHFQRRRAAPSLGAAELELVRSKTRHHMKEPKEFDYFKAWLLFFLIATVGGGLVGMILGSFVATLRSIKSRTARNSSGGRFLKVDRPLRRTLPNKCGFAA